MKYIIYLFVIVLLQSCTTEVNERSERILNSTNSSIYYVEFEKHRYIHYRNGHGVALVHDPDCPYCEFKKK